MPLGPILGRGPLLVVWNRPAIGAFGRGEAAAPGTLPAAPAAAGPVSPGRVMTAVLSAGAAAEAGSPPASKPSLNWPWPSMVRAWAAGSPSLTWAVIGLGWSSVIRTLGEPASGSPARVRKAVTQTTNAPKASPGATKGFFKVSSTPWIAP